jgi:hypothetical protein
MESVSRAKDSKEHQSTRADVPQMLKVDASDTSDTSDFLARLAGAIMSVAL